MAKGIERGYELTYSSVLAVMMQRFFCISNNSCTQEDASKKRLPELGVGGSQGSGLWQQPRQREVASGAIVCVATNYILAI